MDELDELDALVAETQSATVATPHVLEKQKAEQARPQSATSERPAPVVPAADTAPVSQPAHQPKPNPTPAPIPQQSVLTDAPTSDKPLRKPIQLPSWLHTPRPSPDARLIVGLLAGLVFVFASGAAFGLLLSHAAPYAYLTTSLPVYIIAPLEAPAGIVLFLLAAVLLWSYGHDRNSRLLKIIGWLFLVLFVGGIL